ncbi:flavodoxin-dependent (E)-4-hydroxy-3-methylbut-2-enyl-diphosphate synthase [Proteocatella sphenisci]|uniref:flavodoxin-dependent (E)-4-hydroxy-3-methylbut-2-enyl-diphosphate synthase n=1 Tax=Proteocatella sphenisci TaxID=181070 RepID=UPI00048C6D16|nr:flavodoxin-dependent (E)-4-hydroxy-3-methylbut-2-enyl-diphosphate synthase [Proteocatella sphenisci]
MINRRKTKTTTIGDVKIGSGHKVSIQSMTNTRTSDIKATVAQIKRLEEAGCEIVRASVPDVESAEAIKTIVNKINIPLVADIHFDHRLAIKSIENGVDGLRINPGNIGGTEKVREVIQKAKERNIKIRIGVNGGSLEKEIVNIYGKGSDAMVQSAMSHIKILEDLDFYNTVVSLKSSDIFKTIEAYTKFAQMTDYPLHLGITESGTMKKGTIKSAIGIGHMLLNGIGDTIRVSLTADPVEEIYVAKEILSSLELQRDGLRIISCPTCARTRINLIELAESIEEKTKNIKKPITVAIMGCAVNGPGEASEADIGIAGGNGEAILFKKGKIVSKFSEDEIEAVLLKEIENY